MSTCPDYPCNDSYCGDCAAREWLENKSKMSNTKVFFVRIEMGNAGMCTSEHVSWALRKMATQIEQNKYLEDEDFEEISRGIKDDNGNTVGVWGFKDDSVKVY